MIGQIATEYLWTIDQIRYGQFRDKKHLRYLEGQRGLLHQQMVELLDRPVTMETVRRLAARSR